MLRQVLWQRRPSVARKVFGCATNANSVGAQDLFNRRELASFQGTSAVGARTGLRGIYLTPRTPAMNVTYRFRVQYGA
jgi:hypothetical protein